MFLGFYVVHVRSELLLGDESSSEEDEAAMLDAIGAVGLKFLHLGYIDEEVEVGELMIDDYRDVFRGIILREIEALEERAAGLSK
mmetsp:Transcript_12681/g.26837  ORF Transcript_12681/g.26837 Transcript_12681/m.26837 type:complete len:85 (+) Transcript_12681:1258-1512(+)